MPVLLSEVGRRGRMELLIGTRDGQTVIRDAYCEVPFKITRLHPGNPAHLILMQCTAGLFGGDRLECTIHVERGARVLITQQSATKVHPSDVLPAVQDTRISVEAGAELQIQYEPVIPFSGSRLHSTVRMEIDPEARLCYWESLMAGRIGRGEAWQFEELSAETSVRIGGRLAYLDRYCLAPKRCDPQKPWVMGNCGYLGTAIRFDSQDPRLDVRWHDLLPNAGVDSPVPGLTIARVTAVNGPDFHRDAALTRIP